MMGYSRDSFYRFKELYVRIQTNSAGDSARRRPPVPIEAGQGFR